MTPTAGDIYISTALTDVSVAYSQTRNFVTNMIFPRIGVRQQGGQYYVYSRADWFRNDAQPRAAGDEAAEGGWRVSKSPYFADRKALAKNVADPDRANSDAAIDLDQDATEYVTEQIELGWEKNWIDTFFATGTWNGASSSTDMTGAAAPASTSDAFRFWDDGASTPIEDIDGEKTAIAEKTGLMANTLILGAHVWTALKNHPDILARITGVQQGIMTTQLLAQLLDLERVIVLWATNNTSAESATESDASYSFLAGRHALLGHVAPRPALKTPSMGYRVVWTGMTGVPLNGVRVKRFRIELKESDRVEGETWIDDVQVASDLGAFFASAVSTPS